jgi:glycine/serine hydroxymethyltransferase
MGKTEIVQIVEWMDRILQQPENQALPGQVREEVREMCRRFPVYANDA